MNKAIPATKNTARPTPKESRGPDLRFDREARSRPSRWTDRLGDLRLKAALKRAVERDLAPQTLIDSIRNQIRHSE